jgi:DNA-binding response OmpR family regulator
MKILLIDDDDAVRSAVAAMLRSEHAVTEARDVGDALAAILADRPDAVVLDLVLGVATERLHEALAAQQLPVLLFSGKESAELQAVAESRGWRFLAKPFEPAILRKIVGELLARPGRTTAVPTSAMPPAPKPDLVATSVDASTSPAPRDPRVEIADLHSRRLLRGLIAILTTVVTLYFESRGHTVPTPVVVALSVMALGVEGALKAAKARPVTAAGGAAAMVGFALLGDALHVRELSHLAVLGVGGGIPLVTELADRLRG